MSKLRKQWEKQSASEAEIPRPGMTPLLVEAEKALQAGRFDDAVALCESRLAEAPSDIHAQGMLGGCYAAKADYARAEAAFTKLLNQFPGHVPTMISVARAKAAQGKTQEALSLLQDATGRAGRDGPALLGIAEAYLSFGAAAEAVSVYEMVEMVRPNDAEIVFKKASALKSAKRPGDALAEFKRARRLRPDVPHIYANIGELEADAGRYQEAREQYKLAMRYGGPQQPGFGFTLAGLTPIIFQSNEEIDQVRRTIRSEFESLRLSRVRLQDPFLEVGVTNSYNTYHGRPNRDLQEVIARTYLSACPDLAWTAPAKADKGDGRLRIGICSAFMWEHTIGRVMLGLFEKLDRSRFEVVLFRVGRAVDKLGHALDASVDRVVVIGGSLRAARETMASAGLDILMYTDFGAEPLSSFLSYSRLAPVQIVAWGFPDTSGVPNLDYYASTAVFEPPNGAEHYSEVLIAPPRLYSYMYPPDAAVERCTKQELGLDESDRLYLCAQSLFKVHPDFDAAIAGILRQDPKAKVAFFQGHQPQWWDILRERWQTTMPDVADRVIVLPRLDAGRFMGALALADALIDTKHFTGGYTTYLSFANHLPVVTWNGDLMRGRMTQGLYQLMGMQPLSANGDDEFVSLAVRTATDRAFRTDIAKQLAERAPRLFHDEGAVRDFERFLLAAHGAASEGRKLTGWQDVG